MTHPIDLIYENESSTQWWVPPPPAGAFEASIYKVGIKARVYIGFDNELHMVQAVNQVNDSSEFTLLTTDELMAFGLACVKAAQEARRRKL